MTEQFTHFGSEHLPGFNDVLRFRHPVSNTGGVIEAKPDEIEQELSDDEQQYLQWYRRYVPYAESGEGVEDGSK